MIVPRCPKCESLSPWMQLKLEQYVNEQVANGWSNGQIKVRCPRCSIVYTVGWSLGGISFNHPLIAPIQEEADIEIE